ncbi:hypothetical protein QR680_009511 [Steinernema hermaphroditum]|uniref:tRNA (32-2'-O)-methyltransferase regulator THADA n=1 Tax=Steinernema hermaphroditum TaxID=289476 RepID=A0AA39M8Z7_9BILA|nr:hypothetical protein QR680_009511 [Steinernema hermaphroditum]
MAAESPADICRRLRESQSANFEFLFVDSSLLKGACCKKHENFLIDCCLPKIISESLRDANSTKRVYEITHSLSRLVTILRNEKAPLHRNTETVITDFVFCFWDFVQDVVCYECVDIFKLLLEIHSNDCEFCSCGQDTCEWIRKIADFLRECSVLNKSRFRCLIATLKGNSSLYEVLSTGFLTQCYHLLANASLSTVISDLIVFDLTVAHPGVRNAFHLDLIRQAIVSESSLLRSAANDRLLPILFKTPKLAAWFLIEAPSIVQFGEDISDTALEARLSLARFCLFNQQSLGNRRVWSDFIAFDVVRKAVCHTNLQVRLCALNLICDHPKPSLPIAKADFLLYEAFIFFNLSEQSPAARQKILSNFKKILIRMRDSGQTLSKDPQNEIFKSYIRFIEKVHEFSFECLRSDANFNRRYFALCFISHLHCQDFLSSKEKNAFAEQLRLDQLLHKKHLFKLVEFLEDPYQICQETALQILKKLGRVLDKDWFEKFLEATLSNLFSTSKIRNDLDGPYKIRFYCHFNKAALPSVFDRLLEEAESRVRVVSSSLWAITEEDGALHLILNVIGSIVGGGHSGLESSKKKAFKCQALLVSSWRTQKCVSNILHGFVEKLPYPSVLSDDILDAIGKYYMLQLTECKHCGAFETAVEGFEALCQRLWNLNTETPIPEQWLHQILSAIKDGKEMDKLCLTRRSAGLPFLVCAILGTEPSQRQSESLKLTLCTLLDLESLDFDSKIHAVNVLRSVFNDNRVREAVLVGVEWAFRICIEGAGSEQWPLRNALSQLFAALLVRVFGVSRQPQRSLTVQQKCKLSAFEFFSRFPTLFDFIHEQLSLKLDGQNEFRVFPILILLCHLFPSTPQIVGTHRGRSLELSTFISMVWKILMSAKGEKTRELAVASLVSISEKADILYLADTLQSTKEFSLPSNKVNAVLLMLLGCVETWSTDHAIIEKISRISQTLWDNSCRTGNWPKFNVQLLVNLVNEVGSTDLRRSAASFAIMNWNEKSLDLTARPLGKLFSSFAEFWERDAVPEKLRIEAYRSLFLSKKEPPSPILAWAVKDAVSSSSPWVWGLVALSVQTLKDNHALKDISRDLSSFSEKALESYVHVLTHVQPLSSVVLNWIRDAAVSDDVEVRLSVVQMIVGILTRHDGCEAELYDLLALLLQDEDVEVREEAAKAISGLQKIEGDKTRALSAEICWSFALKKHPNLAMKISAFQGASAEPEELEGVFDACARNPFAESFGSPHISVVKELFAL